MRVWSRAGGSEYWRGPRLNDLRENVVYGLMRVRVLSRAWGSERGCGRGLEDQLRVIQGWRIRVMVWSKVEA